MSSVTGKCLCGKITVSIPKKALETDTSIGICICHCKNCCRAGGSLGAISVIVPESDVQITGQPKIYQDSDTESRTSIQRTFCDNCGSPIYTATPNVTGIRVVRLALFDNIPKPSIETYCKSMPTWNKPIDGVKQFDTMPPK